MPLPNSTASASSANSSGCCAVIVTPFIDVTCVEGLAISACTPCGRSRLISASATNESNSLKPSKVTIATRMGSLSGGGRRLAPGNSVFQERAQHPGGLLVDGEPLRQQVGG